MKNVMRSKSAYVMLTVSMLLTVGVASAWINGVGSPSTDPNNPVIGTHDRILNSAINMLPVDYQSKINITAADYGTEMPDYNMTQCSCIYGLRDQRYHQVYFWSNGTLQDDSSARRAMEEYNLAMENLSIGDNYNFSIHVGMMSHYMADISNFAHTIGNHTDWISEGLPVHGAYENLIANNSNKFIGTNIKFDGKYDNITAYNATLDSANDTTFDNKFGNGTYTNMWMYYQVNGSMDNGSTNLTYTTASSELIARAKQSLNYNVNLLTDVLYTMVSKNITVVPPVPNVTATPTSVPTAVPHNGGSSSGSSSSSSGGSSGGGGGGMGTAEPYENIYKYETQDHSVSTTPELFSYKTQELGIYDVLVTSTQSNIATLRIEVLKDTSKLVGKPASGVVYKNINMWVDYKRIKNATIMSKIENSWMDENGLLADNIRMSMWDNTSKEWVELLTSVPNKDDKYTYFEFQTDSLSGSFAISGIKEEDAQTQVESQASVAQITPKEVDKTEIEQTEVEPVSTDEQKAPGFGMIVSVVSILSVAYLFRRIRRQD